MAAAVNASRVSALIVSVLVAACASAPSTSLPAEALNPDVRPETIDQTICVPGYAASVRPATSYTTGVKRKLLREAGVDLSAAPNYDLDHIIPLAVGGHPRNPKNLNPMLRDGEGGARVKARLDKQLQRLVCSRQLGLREAQAAVFNDWKTTYVKYVGATSD
jgi:hypothetical protein